MVGTAPVRICGVTDARAGDRERGTAAGNLDTDRHADRGGDRFGSVVRDYGNHPDGANDPDNPDNPDRANDPDNSDVDHHDDDYDNDPGHVDRHRSTPERRARPGRRQRPRQRPGAR